MRIELHNVENKVNVKRAKPKCMDKAWSLIHSALGDQSS